MEKQNGKENEERRESLQRQSGYIQQLRRMYKKVAKEAVPKRLQELLDNVDDFDDED